MSSRDIGPALPPHMRRNQRTDEDVGSRSSSVHDQETYYKQDRLKKSHREKYSERERRADRDRDRNKRDSHRDFDRSRGYRADRGHNKDREAKDLDARTKTSRQIDTEEEEEDRHRLSLKRSKRSKTDRTYNTDTEESSDENCDMKKWTKVAASSSSESDREDGNVKVCKKRIDEPVSFKESDDLDKPGSNKGENSPSCDNYMMPALPSHLIKASSCTMSGEPPSSFSPLTEKLPSERSYSSSAVEKSAAERLHSKTELVTERKEGESIGPALPPHLQKARSSSPQLDDEAFVIGPALPVSLRTSTAVGATKQITGGFVGPALPPHFSIQPTESLSGDDSSVIGPALPPHLSVQPCGSHSDDEASVIGPALPPALKAATVVGPTLPPGMNLNEHVADYSDDASSDEEVVGPLLPEQMLKSERNLIVQAQLERNAAAIKQRLEQKDLNESDVTAREEWMLTLPPESTVDLGLGPRTFRARGAPEKGADRSSWTDTPADKARKEEEAKRRFELGITSTDEVKKAAIAKELSTKDQSMEAVVKKHKRSKESLLEAHQRKLKKEKKKKEKAGVKQERRPFNRETDLKTNVFDDAQKKAIYKKAQILDTRFSSGESKYL